MILMKLLKVIISLVFIAATVLLCFSGPLHEADGSAEYLIGSAKVQLTSGVYPSDTKALNTVISAHAQIFPQACLRRLFRQHLL